MKHIIDTPNAPAPLGAYSQAILVGHNLYIAGQIGLKSTEDNLPNDFKMQAEQAFENIKAIIEAAGGFLMDALKLTVYVTDINNVSVLNEVMAACFKQPYPTRAVVEVKALPKNAMIEIEALALLD